MAGSAPPVPLSELKKPAVLPDINEFDIGKWLHSAIDLLNKADTSWQRVQQGLGPPQLAEDAYRNWRRVGESVLPTAQTRPVADIISRCRIMSQLRRHRDFDKLVQQKLPALYTYHAIREVGPLTAGPQTWLTRLLAAPHKRRHVQIYPGLS